METKQYPELSENIVAIGNRNSMYNRGNNLRNLYNEYLSLIDKNDELSQSQKNELAKKLHNLYSDYAMRSASVLNPMVTGPARFPIKQNQKRLSGERSAWEKLQEFIEKYPHIFKADKDYWGKSLREENNNREALFQCEDYKIVEYTLKTGEKRIGFHFVMRIKRQLQVALKSRGFRWNSNVNLWGGKFENYEKHKEWCENLSKNYTDYLR